MHSHSPYSINFTDPIKWRPGEEIAVSALAGMTLCLFVEVNMMIFYAFKKRQGLYFWSMQCGTLGVFVETVGIILKFFCSPGTDAIWPLYMLFLLVGWSVYTTAQSLVLYSRLHLVMRNQRIQRYVLYMILSTIFTFVLPHWIFEWPAANTSDHEMSSLWSPRAAIVRRYSQIGYTITESIISGLYIWSLIPILRLKSNVRQQRVMMDLLLVNVVIIALDIIQVSFAYTNQGVYSSFHNGFPLLIGWAAGISEPLQSFSYILKLRLEFVVLNQLMEFAARGMHHGTFGKNRYYYTTNKKERPVHDNVRSHKGNGSHLTIKKNFSEDPPQPALSSSMPLLDSISLPDSTYQIRPITRSGSGAHSNGLESQPESYSFERAGIADHERSSSDENPLTPNAKVGAGFFENRPQAVKGINHQSSGSSKDSKPPAFERDDRFPCRKSKDDGDGEEEGGIGLHMWERRGTIVVGLPWFLSKVEV
ncbi:hypothetical protein MMC29_000672 [Sticta canariensis]|nr:hypothetical protein [Sticta canariensis]